MKHYKVLVVGGGHAGVEAALASTRMGLSTALITIDKDAIARMSCNPAIGGLAKGHLVREIDALGGQMGISADITGIQFKILNRSKGRAVWSLRAQIDKKAYEKHLQNVMSLEPLLTVTEDEVVSLILKSDAVCGVRLLSGIKIYSDTVILTCGTFLNGLIHIGRKKIKAGRMGEEASNGISENLASIGFKVGRLKTGTPPRLKKSSINWNLLKAIFGDKDPKSFSFLTKDFSPPNIPCHLAKTNPFTHEIINNSLGESPLYRGEIEGIGPRYCPSIEDKIVRFADKLSHQLFLEPEWQNSSQIYTNGFSTSLPEHVQLNALRTVNGLEKVEFIRPGYAIEYDFFPPSQLRASLETKDVRGLFFAGQINGTSGYEEAAAQGIIAGINAVQYVRSDKPLLLSRDRAYIGVLIDDLITKDTLEPYRMFTARAEYRLMLRHTNANRRLSKLGYQVGLLTQQKYDYICKQIEFVDQTVELFNSSTIPHDIVNKHLSKTGDSPVNGKITISRLLKRPNVTVEGLINDSILCTQKNDFSNRLLSELYEEAETTIKYEGYIKRQFERVAFLQKNENARLPQNIDYSSINALSNEAKEKLSFVQPETIGQASRISGVSPSDVSILSVLFSR